MRRRAKVNAEKPIPFNRCQQCNKTFPAIAWRKLNKYCSSSCAASRNNKLYPKLPPAQRESHCLHCGVAIAGEQKQYCSTAHASAKVHEERVRLWLTGETDGGGARGTLRKYVRNYMLQQAEYRCSKCGWSEVNPSSGRIPLEVDHIDGDCTNNLITNLRVLCPNCHSLTPTFKNLNAGNGRTARRVKAMSG